MWNIYIKITAVFKTFAVKTNAILLNFNNLYIFKYLKHYFIKYAYMYILYLLRQWT